YAANNPGWRDVERLAARLDIRCITRKYPVGAKAGNLMHTWDMLSIPDRALVAVFDADHAPTPQFFVETLSHFADPAVGWVQTGQYYRNTDNLIANWADQQMLLFYDNLCPYKARSNALFLCGTNFVLRARALNEIGGLPMASPTEDFAASLPMHINGWRSVYLSQRLSSGLGPMDMKSYLRQQSRWARGCLMVMRDYWQHIFLPWKRGLTLNQRFHYFLSGTHYLGGLRDLVFVLTPVIFLLLGVSAIRSESPIYLVSFTAYWAIGMMAAANYMVDRVSIWRVNMMSFGCFPMLVRSFQRVLVQDHQPFDVTSKQRLVQGNRLSLLPHVGFAALIILSLVIGWGVHSAPRADIAVNTFWLVYSLANLIGFVVLGVMSDIRATDS
ncbi:MAG: glycosyltransferase family 2 protein, partial [Chloroflexota bacterium]